jgi:hypothetical protein
MATSLEEEVPERRGRGDVARHPAPDPDYRNRFVKAWIALPNLRIVA